MVKNLLSANKRSGAQQKASLARSAYKELARKLAGFLTPKTGDGRRVLDNKAEVTVRAGRGERVERAHSPYKQTTTTKMGKT